MDYHSDAHAYFAAKAGLFERVMAADGCAVLNADDDRVAGLAGRCRARGAAGAHLRQRRCGPAAAGAARYRGGPGSLPRHRRHGAYQVALPLPGAFQAHNALAALGLALATGVEAEAAVAALGAVTGVPGRLQRIAGHPAGAPVFVDYAHTPDALAAALYAVRPLVSGRLVVVFGCGGERDSGKRREMGAVAARLADRVVVTDDNFPPRGPRRHPAGDPRLLPRRGGDRRSRPGHPQRRRGARRWTTASSSPARATSGSRSWARAPSPSTMPQWRGAPWRRSPGARER